MMNAQEIIAYIGAAEKKTPVKVYVNENAPISYGSATVFGEGASKVVFGDWRELGPILEENAGNIRDLVAGVIEPASATPVIVEDGVLVGANAVVIEGVHVGKNAVVAAGAVVIEDVPENAVVAGCPARVVKMKDEGTTQKTALEAALRKL